MLHGVFKAKTSIVTAKTVEIPTTSQATQSTQSVAFWRFQAFMLDISFGESMSNDRTCLSEGIIWIYKGRFLEKGK